METGLAVMFAVLGGLLSLMAIGGGVWIVHESVKRLVEGWGGSMENLFFGGIGAIVLTLGVMLAVATKMLVWP